MRCLVLFVLALAGCASVSPQAAMAVTPARLADVAACRYLGDVTGASRLYGLFVESGLERARADAVQRAHELGATHLVWSPPGVQYGATAVTASAYRCG